MTITLGQFLIFYLFFEFNILLFNWFKCLQKRRVNPLPYYWGGKVHRWPVFSPGSALVYFEPMENGEYKGRMPRGDRDIYDFDTNDHELPVPDLSAPELDEENEND